MKEVKEIAGGLISVTTVCAVCGKEIEMAIREGYPYDQWVLNSKRRIDFSVTMQLGLSKKGKPEDQEKEDKVHSYEKFSGEVCSIKCARKFWYTFYENEKGDLARRRIDYWNTKEIDKEVITSIFEENDHKTLMAIFTEIAEDSRLHAQKIKEIGEVFLKIAEYYHLL